MRNRIFLSLFILMILAGSIGGLTVTTSPNIAAKITSDSENSWTVPIVISQSLNAALTTSSDRGMAATSHIESSCCGGLIVVHGIHVAFYGNDESGDNDSEIYYSLSENGIWSDPFNITKNEVSDKDPVIHVDSQGNVHIVYSGWDGNDYEIFYTNGTSLGWNIPLNVSQNQGNDTSPSIVIDSLGILHVVWQGTNLGEDTEVFYASKSNGSWNTPYNVTQNDLDDSVTSIAVSSDDKIHVVGHYRDGSSFDDLEIFHIDNTEGTWKFENVTKNDIDDYDPSFGIDSLGNIHVTFGSCNSTGNSSGVYYSKRTSVGWQNPINISLTSRSIGGISLAVDIQNNIHVAFEQRDDSSIDGDNEVFYTNNRQENWSIPLNVTQNDINDYNPNLVIGLDGYAHLVYWRTVSNNTNAVLYTRSSRTVGPLGDPPSSPAADDNTILIVVGASVLVGAVGVASLFLIRKRRQDIP